MSGLSNSNVSCQAGNKGSRCESSPSAMDSGGSTPLSRAIDNLGSSDADTNANAVPTSSHKDVLRELELTCWRQAFKARNGRMDVRTHVRAIATFGRQGSIERVVVEVLPEPSADVSDCVEETLRVFPLPLQRSGTRILFETDL